MVFQVKTQWLECLLKVLKRKRTECNMQIQMITVTTIRKDLSIENPDHGQSIALTSTQCLKLKKVLFQEWVLSTMMMRMSSSLSSRKLSTMSESLRMPSLDLSRQEISTWTMVSSFSINKTRAGSPPLNSMRPFKIIVSTAIRMMSTRSWGDTTKTQMEGWSTQTSVTPFRQRIHTMLLT